jgi:uncharacterized protein (DUF433 family)
MRGNDRVARIEIGKYLAVDTRVCGGRLIFKGSRILVSDALELFAAGYTAEAVAKQYRGLITPDAVREAKSLVLRGFVKEVTNRVKVAA